MIGAARVPEILARVVNASQELSDAEKRIWCEIRRLADIPGQTARCFASPEHLALGLGLSVVTVKAARRLLKHVRLLDSATRPTAKTWSWWPMVPPLGPLPGGGRLPDDELRRLRDALDALVRTARTGVPPDASVDQRRTTAGASHRMPHLAGKTDQEATHTGVSPDAPIHHTGVPVYASPPGQGVPPYAPTGIPGDAPYSELKKVVESTTPLPSQENGAVAHDRKEEGVRERPLPPEWDEAKALARRVAGRSRIQPTPIADVLPGVPSPDNGAAVVTPDQAVEPDAAPAEQADAGSVVTSDLWEELLGHAP